MINRKPIQPTTNTFLYKNKDMERIYYYETIKSHGTFSSKSDESALETMKTIPGCIFLYRESDAENGQPFVELYYNNILKTKQQ